MFRNLALTLGAGVALCSAAAFVAGAHGTTGTAQASTASTSQAVQLAVTTHHHSGYIVASS